MGRVSEYAVHIGVFLFGVVVVGTYLGLHPDVTQIVIIVAVGFFILAAVSSRRIDREYELLGWKTAGKFDGTVSSIDFAELFEFLEIKGVRITESNGDVQIVSAPKQSGTRSAHDIVSALTTMDYAWCAWNAYKDIYTALQNFHPECNIDTIIKVLRKYKEKKWKEGALKVEYYAVLEGLDVHIVATYNGKMEYEKTDLSGFVDEMQIVEWIAYELQVPPSIVNDSLIVYRMK